MRIITNNLRYDPFWVYAHVLENLWLGSELYCDKGCAYIDDREVAHQMPHNSWFKYSRNGMRCAFITPCIEIESGIGKKNIVAFLNGRHRTRWMMRYCDDLIPIGINASEIESFGKYQLICRPVDCGDLLPIQLQTEILNKDKKVNSLVQVDKFLTNEHK